MGDRWNWGLVQLVPGLSLQKPWLGWSSFHVGFVVDKVALGQFFLRVFLPVSIIPPMRHCHTSFIYHPRCIIFFAIYSVVKYLPPPQPAHSLSGMWVESWPSKIPGIGAAFLSSKYGTSEGWFAEPEFSLVWLNPRLWILGYSETLLWQYNVKLTS